MPCCTLLVHITIWFKCNDLLLINSSELWQIPWHSTLNSKFRLMTGFHDSVRVFCITEIKGPYKTKHFTGAAATVLDWTGGDSELVHSHSVGSSRCPPVLSPYQGPSRPCDKLVDRCHREWSLLPADRPHSNPDDPSHIHHHHHHHLAEKERVTFSIDYVKKYIIIELLMF